jgi:hypothetical protein
MSDGNVTEAERDLIGWWLRNDAAENHDFTITIAREGKRWFAQLVNDDTGEVLAGRGLSFDEAWTAVVKNIGGCCV